MMKKFSIAISVLLFFTGCNSVNTIAKGISGKSISASGAFIYNRTGLDKETQTPELLNLFIWGDYSSVMPGDEIFRLEETEDSSIFNAAAKTQKKENFLCIWG